jgi:hypothetical protein
MEGRDGHYGDNDLSGGEAEQCCRFHMLNDLSQLR